MNSLLAPLFAAGMGLALAGCSTSLAQRAERSDGLLDFLFDQPSSERAMPIEMVSAVGGTIETAHVRVYSREAFVSGLVGRGAHRALLGAHVDVEVLNAAGKIAQAYAISYLPSPIPSGRLGHSYSRYAVRLQTTPVPGSSVRVSFHNDSKSTCAFAVPANVVK